jgi:tRNA (cmo5U34)-methyltransferase
MNEKDRLFSSGAGAAGEFVFDERVVRVFPDMISRSVPGYDLVVPLTGMLARRYAQDGSCVYDLGCSLGATTLAMRAAIRARGIQMVAVDTSAAMLASFRARLAAEDSEIPVRVLESDILDVDFEDASVVAMNFTLQFIPPEKRGALMTRICQGLRPGGVLLLSEKIRFETPAEQRDQTAWHEDYKRAMGYSELEIAGKRTALENVLHPDSENEHRQRLAAVGFRSVERWFQCFSFCSYLAIR